MKRILFVISSCALLFTSCKKDEDVVAYDPNVKAPITVEFDNVVGSANLQLNTGSYSNAVGETFTITKLKYFISNISLTRTDGTVYTVPQNDSYFLVDEADEASHDALLQVPEGEYKSIDFLIGVDSLRSTLDISQRTGDLDVTGVAADMYWSWNSGYIFFKMEGTSSVATAPGNEFLYHIGGFGGYSAPTINNIKKISIDLMSRGVPKVKTGRTPNIHLMVDVLKVFNGSPNVSIASNSVVMFNPFSTTVAANYAGMFTHDHTEN